MPNGLLREEPMKENGNRTYLTQGLSCWISDIAFSRFRSFCNHVLGVRIDELPSEQSIFMRQNFFRSYYARPSYTCLPMGFTW